MVSTDGPARRSLSVRRPLEAPSLTSYIRERLSGMSTLPTLDSNRAKRGATLPFSLTWNGGEITGTLYPGIYTGRFMRDMADANVWIPVSRLLASWDYTLSPEDPDVTEDLRGQVCPITEEALEEFVPIPLLHALYSRLLKVLQNPNPETPPE